MEIRELIFRGFHPCEGPETIVVDGEKVKGRWVEGSLLTYKDGTTFVCCEDYIPDVLNKYEVLPSTVGQYIGLTDKNGKRIFDGDKVKGFNYLHQREEEYIVVWACNNGFYFVDDSETEWHPEHIIPCEVIGTVFDEVTP